MSGSKKPLYLAGLFQNAILIVPAILFSLCSLLVSPLYSQLVVQPHSITIQAPDGRSRTWKVGGYIESVGASINLDALKDSITETSGKLSTNPVKPLVAIDFNNDFGIMSQTLHGLGAKIDRARLRTDVYQLVDFAHLLHRYETLAERSSLEISAPKLLSEAATLMLQRKEVKRDPIAVEAIAYAIDRIGAVDASTTFLEVFGKYISGSPPSFQADTEEVLGFAAEDSDAGEYGDLIERRRAQLEEARIPRLRKQRALRQLKSVEEYLTDASSPRQDIVDEIMRQLRAWIRAGADPDSPRIKKVQAIIDPGGGFGFTGENAEGGVIPFASPAFVELVNQTDHSLYLQIDGEYYGQLPAFGNDIFMVPSGTTSLSVIHPEFGIASKETLLNQHQTFRYTITP